MFEVVEGADAFAFVTSLFDGRDIRDPKELRALGFWYTGIGRP